jgi:mono/diheme cytochrome c family protein
VKARALLAGAAVVCVCAVLALSWWRSANVGAVQRGADLSRTLGCAACHTGPGDASFLARPFADINTADPTTLREWILDGESSRVRNDPEVRQMLAEGPIRMPAWRGRLSDRQVNDLVAYVRAVATVDVPTNAEAQRGYDIAEQRGCFRCHGPEGRGAAPNPRSLKGYVPPWDGADYEELVENDGELREWIMDGRPQRLQRNRIARFFLDRQEIRMPAFRGNISDEELTAIGAYIHWLRGQASSPQLPDDQMTR